MSKPVIASGSKKTPHPMKRFSKVRSENRPYSSSDDCGENQSDSSASNSSLASSPRYLERHPRMLERARKKNSGILSSPSNEKASANKNSFLVPGSRTSLPPLDENAIPLNATESQLSLNLRRATRSTSWTNQKILDAIDGLNTCAHEIDPCLALVQGKVSLNLDKDKEEESNNKNESPRKYSFEKFVVPRSISNLIMKSRSSGSVSPGQSPGQNRENSNYILSGIREVDDEEQLQQDDATTGINIALIASVNGKYNNNCCGSSCGGSSGAKLKGTSASNSKTDGVSHENEPKAE